MKLRANAYPLPAGGYRGCLIDTTLIGVAPTIIWRCPHRHTQQSASAMLGRGPTLTSALDCAKAELAHRASSNA